MKRRQTKFMLIP